MKTCPYCAEEIKEEALKCKHCGSMLNEPQEQRVPQLNATERNKGKNKMVIWVSALLVLAIIIVGLIVVGKKDNSSPTSVVGKFVIAIKDNDLGSARKFLSSDGSELFSDSDLEKLYIKSRQAPFIANPSSIVIRNDEAFEYIDWLKEDDIQQIGFYLNKTFWGWKITNIEE